VCGMAVLQCHGRLFYHHHNLSRFWVCFN
jgi:hypothetical protein